MERTTVVQKTQIGVETVPGTPVAAGKRLQATSIEFNPQMTNQEFRPLGNKYATLEILQREYMQADISGYPAFTDIVYLLSSLVSAPTITTVATGVKKWTFDSASSSLDSPKTFTVEQGDGVRAGRFSNFIVSQLGLKFNRQTVGLTGQGLGSAIDDGITLTASPTEIGLVPMLGTGFDVFVDPLVGDIGTTKLGRLFDGDWSLADRFGPVWPVDSSLGTSFGTTVELTPKIELKATMEADASGMAFLDQFRAGDTAFCRITNIGPLIDDTNHYSLTIDTAIKVTNMDKYADQEGVYAIPFTFAGVEDSGWGKAFHIEVVNTLAAL